MVTYKEPRLLSFSPIVDERTRVVVLGSMPGKRSLEAHEYYAHPRNSFWNIIEDIYGIERRLDYTQRLEALLAVGIGLWDVVGSCERRGSLDSAMINVQNNDLVSLLQSFPGIRSLILNGGAALRFFSKDKSLLELIEEKGIVYVGLPSTSPANALMKYDEKLEMWRTALIARNLDH